MVERMVPFVRSSFWKGREFGSIPEINSANRTWCLEVAGKRTLGTTGLQPYRHFDSVERPAMKSLPLEPFEMSAWTTAQVWQDCHIQVERAFYSVPYRYVGRRVDVRITQRTVQCFLEEELIKTHTRVVPRKRSTDWSDYPPDRPGCSGGDSRMVPAPGPRHPPAHRAVPGVQGRSRVHPSPDLWRPFVSHYQGNPGTRCRLEEATASSQHHFVRHFPARAGRLPITYLAPGPAYFPSAGGGL
jgi:hypothetical protein